MLQFVGIGSAFNTKYCENSAFIKDGKSILLIDCGGMVFHRLRELNLLDGIEKIYIAVTHTHPDHVGSLGNLLFYTYYALQVKAVVLFPEKDFMVQHLRSVGVTQQVYQIEHSKKVALTEIRKGLKLEFLEYAHDENIPAFNLILSDHETQVYYSGDANTIRPSVLNQFEEGIISQIYQDTCSFDFHGNPHMWLAKLEKLIRQEYRQRVYCMHLDERFEKEKAEELGFRVAVQI